MLCPSSRSEKTSRGGALEGGGPSYRTSVGARRVLASRACPCRQRAAKTVTIPSRRDLARHCHDAPRAKSDRTHCAEETHSAEERCGEVNVEANAREVVSLDENTLTTNPDWVHSLVTVILFGQFFSTLISGPAAPSRCACDQRRGSLPRAEPVDSKGTATKAPT